MARTSETLTQKEIDNYKAFCREHYIVADESSEDGLRNGAEIGNYITITWGQDITPATLAVALDKLRDRIVFYTPAQVEYINVADKNRRAAQQVWDWLENQKSLVNTGDQGFQNASSILRELGDRAVTPETIRTAIARIGAPSSKFHAARRQLHFVQERRTEPVSRAAKEDTDYSTGQLFSHSDMVKMPDGSLRSKTPAEQRADRERAEAAEKAKSQSTQTLDPSEASWKGLADGLLNDGHHGQQARVRAVYDHEVNQGSSWRKVYEACKREANAHSRTIRGSNGFMDEFKDSIRRQ